MLKIASILLLYFYQLCLGEGNFHLMEEEISNALQDCSQLNDKLNIKVNIEKRQRRHNDFRYYAFRIDANSKQEINQYNHERRNTSTENDKNINVNDSGINFSRYPYGGIEEDLINSGNRQTIDDDRKSNLKQQRRSKRNEPLVSKDDVDKVTKSFIASHYTFQIPIFHIPRYYLKNL